MIIILYQITLVKLWCFVVILGLVILYIYIHVMMYASGCSMFLQNRS